MIDSIAYVRSGSLIYLVLGLVIFAGLVVVDLRLRRISDGEAPPASCVDLRDDR
jgi:hypothetical protein